MLQPSIANSTEDSNLYLPSTHSTEDLQDLIMSSDCEAAAMNPPPPHIAARFYCQKSTRRKSSAASSRRNSLSSLHSNRSNRSSHGGPQSTHIAQHLRRASIIETRKARLADKAAHAEKVRLRAALVKAAPRLSTTSENRALAAQQARERYLAQVAANCAEEVKRAKKIAEDVKEKKAAEHLKLKGDMEDRLADAERRRLLYQQNLRRNRTQNLAAVEEKKVTLSAWKPRSETTAARLIQRAWRCSKRRKALAEFVQLDLTVENVQKTSFEDVSDLLAQERVLSSTAKILKLCGLQDKEVGGPGESVAVRIFLSTFLVLGHPLQVFSHDGEQEQDLAVKARALLHSFESIISALPRTFNCRDPSGELASLSEAYASFQTAFTAWKNHDSSILLETMVAQFVELDAIWQMVKNDTDGHVADDYKEGIQQNQTLLLVRLKRLAGAEKALQMVSAAVKLRRRSKKRRTVGDVIPRGASKPTGSSRTLNIPQKENNADLAPSVSSRSVQASELSKVISPLPDNRTICHELAINKDYRLNVDPQSELRIAINRAVFDTMRSDVGAGRGDQWIISMAETIRERLLRVVTPGKPLHVLISETLDTGMIQNQLKAGNFSYEKFFSFMNSILPKLCAPVRDPEVKALAANESDDYIGRLSQLMHIIDLLGLDYANFLLQLSSSEIISKASEYEQQCFKQYIRNRKLSKTIRWWSRAHAKLQAENIHSATTSDSPPIGRSPLTSDKIYTQGLVELFISITPLEPIDLPETLELDKERAECTRAETLRIISISTILLTAKNLLKRDVRSSWKVQAQRMWDLSNPYDESNLQSYLSIIESGHTLPPNTRISLIGTIERVLGEARNPQAVSHPVMKVLLQKIRAHTISRLTTGSAEERVRSASTASEVLGGSGMVESVARIGSMIEELGRIKKIDWESHGKWLDEVRAEVERERR